MNPIPKNVFLSSVLANVPRLLGQLNRNPLSITYGSFDRAYWHYRTNDINNARCQEAALTLTLLYKYDFPGNKYYHSEKILGWINASLSFILKTQNRDGSFNEWYINEGSYVATAFVSAALAEILGLMGKEKIIDYEEILDGLEKAADWLAKHNEVLVFNQLAGSIFALAKISSLTGREKYLEAAGKKLNLIISRQSSEGWWSEYGGPDAGYLSLMIDYLAKYYELDRREDVLGSIKRACAFLVNFLHPNFTAGGEYMSRNTEYLIPSGFVYLSAFDVNAEIITAFNIASLSSGSGVGPDSLDDRYLCYILYNWLQAGISLSYSDISPYVDINKYLATRRMDIFFKDSGIRIRQTDKYYFVANLYKGGAFRLYFPDRHYLDSGIEINLAGRGSISGALDYSNEVASEESLLMVSGKLKPVKEPLMKTPIMILFKTWQLVFGKFGNWQTFLKDFLRKRMISYKDSSDILFKREFIINSDSLIVEDWIGKLIKEKDFFCGQKASYNFIPSSKFFTSQEVEEKGNPAEREFSGSRKGCSLRRTFSF
ncbi:MAG: prenyltransferase/squalene oxidase repeat-containing protein [Patescibacteria group bacterium]|jgi:hypothetical protein